MNSGTSFLFTRIVVFTISCMACAMCIGAYYFYFEKTEIQDASQKQEAERRVREIAKGIFSNAENFCEGNKGNLQDFFDCAFFWNGSEQGVSSEIKFREGLGMTRISEAVHSFVENIFAEGIDRGKEDLLLVLSYSELASRGGVAVSIGISPPRHAFAEPFRGFVSGESDWWIVRSFRGGGSFFVQGFLVNKNKFLSVINSEISEIGFVAPSSHALGDASFLCEGLPIFIRGNANFGGVPMSMRVLLFAAFCVSALMGAFAVFALGSVQRARVREQLFSTAIAHDLRTPLMLIEAQAEKFVERSRKGGSSIWDFLRHSRDVKNLSDSVENIFAFFKLSCGIKSPNFPLEKIIFGEFFNAVAERLNERMSRAGFDFDVQVPPEARRAVIIASSVALERILFNLADNVARHAKTARNVPTLMVSAKTGNVMLNLYVEDNGGGLPDSVLRNVCKKNGRIRFDENVISASGLGIGLALSVELAQSMKATLLLEKSDNEGTTFLLRLKLA